MAIPAYPTATDDTANDWQGRSSAPAAQNGFRMISTAPVRRDRREARHSNPPNLQGFRPAALALTAGRSLRVAPLVFTPRPLFENPFESGIRWVALDRIAPKVSPATRQTPRPNQADRLPRVERGRM